MSIEATPTAKPILRGYLHAIAAGLAVIGFVRLMQLSPPQLGRRLPLIVYGSSLIIMFTVSAAYHLGRWGTVTRSWLRRWDHSNIFLLIAGTYTPLVASGLFGAWRVTILLLIWILAGVGLAAVAPFLQTPRRLLATLYVLMGWVAVVAIPQLATSFGVGATVLMALAGLQYTAGAVIYALQRPRLWPSVFGYHELFHLAVVSASATFYLVVLQHGVGPRP